MLKTVNCTIQLFRLTLFHNVASFPQGRSKPFQRPRQGPFSAPPLILNLKEVFAYEDVILFKPVHSSGLTEGAGCAKVCKMGAPIFNLRAFKDLWLCFYYNDCILFSRKLILIFYIKLLVFIFFNSFSFLTWRQEVTLKWLNINSLWSKDKVPQSNVRGTNQNVHSP